VAVLSEPVESIEQEYEVNNPAGLDTNDLHAPLSRVENRFGVAVTMTEVPATPLVADSVNVGAAVTLRVVCA
jgi:hypothetical protein